MTSHLRAALRCVLPLVLLLAVAGCGEDRASTAAPDRPTPTVTAAPDPGPSLAAVDWDDPATTELTGGWTLGPCEGDAPLVCFSRDGRVQGTAEITSFPVDTLPAVRDALAQGEAAALQAHAEEYLESFRADRTAGCGAGYDFRADDVRRMAAAGTPVVKTAFEGGNGGTTERVVRWVGLRAGRLVALGITSTDDGACVPGEGAELTPPQLAELEPLLDRLVEAGPLPTGAG